MRSWSQIPDFEMAATNLRPLAASGCRRPSLKQSWGPRGWLVSVDRKELLVPEEKLATYNIYVQRRHTDWFLVASRLACSQPISPPF